MGEVMHTTPNLTVGERGFEPPTSASRTLRATGLRHSPYGAEHTTETSFRATTNRVCSPEIWAAYARHVHHSDISTLTTARRRSVGDCCGPACMSVSYTHLTLPTILRV